MHEVIVCEKPKASEKIAGAIPGKAVKKSYKKVPYYEIEKDGKKNHSTFCCRSFILLISLKKKEKGRMFEVGWVPLYEKDKSKRYVKNYIDAIKKNSLKMPTDLYMPAITTLKVL